MHESTEISKSPDDMTSPRGPGRPKLSDDPKTECLSIAMTSRVLRVLEATAKRWNMPTSTLAFNILDHVTSKRDLSPSEARFFARGAAFQKKFFADADSSPDRSAS